MVTPLLDKSDVFTSRDVISAEGLAIIAGMLLSTAGTNQHCQTDVDGPALTVMMQVSIYTKMYTTAFSSTKMYTTAFSSTKSHANTFFPVKWTGARGGDHS